MLDDVTNDEARMCDVCSAVCRSVRALQKHKKVKHDTHQCICKECCRSVVGMDKLRRYHKSLITNYKQITNYTQVSQEESQNLDLVTASIDAEIDHLFPF